jgi:SAM-dependent methyltransferase
LTSATSRVRAAARRARLSSIRARGHEYAIALAGAFGRVLPRGRRNETRAVPIQSSRSNAETKVDRYWGRHTVRAPGFANRRSSKRYLEWRFAEYPLFRELTGLWGRHDGEVLLDYGCGPGNDLTGLAIHTGARRLIGIDVSERALALASQRLSLHGVDQGRVQLIHVADGDPGLPLEAESVDYAQSLGVIHHTSDPAAVLRQLHRVLKPGGTGCVMVYNRNSVWLHLYTAYERMIREGAFPGLDVEEAFARNTDGPDCPISRCYRDEDFTSLCQGAGFESRYAGGYLSRRELRSLRESWVAAIADGHLGDEHRDFLRALTFDAAGLPMYRGYHAGIGGVYHLRKPPASDAAIVTEPDRS